MGYSRGMYKCFYFMNFLLLHLHVFSNCSSLRKWFLVKMHESVQRIQCYALHHNKWAFWKFTVVLFVSLLQFLLWLIRHGAFSSRSKQFCHILHGAIDSMTHFAIKLCFANIWKCAYGKSLQNGSYFLQWENKQAVLRKMSSTLWILAVNWKAYIRTLKVLNRG